MGDPIITWARTTIVSGIPTSAGAPTPAVPQVTTIPGDTPGQDTWTNNVEALKDVVQGQQAEIDGIIDGTIPVPVQVTTTKMIAGGSAPISVGSVLVPAGNNITLATPTAVAASALLGGIAIAAGAGGQIIALVTQGPVDTGAISLGSGFACAVGVNAAGMPVRATDPSCTSGLSFIGTCDTTGAIFVAPRKATTYVATDFGFVDGATNDLAARYLIEAVRSRRASGTITFPAGDFYFNQCFGPIPGGVSIEGGGFPAVFSANRGTRLIFNGPGAGVFYDIAGTGGNSTHGGTIQHVAVAGNLNTDHTAPLVTTPFNTRIWSGGVSPIPTLTGVATTTHVWDIYIQTPTTFQWSSDGGTTYTLDVPIAASVLLTDGITVHFPGGTYVPGDSWVAQTVQNINECGIEVIGDIGVTVQFCLTNGFKYQVSFDGAGPAALLNHNFQSAGPDLHGYADMITNLGDNSAAGFRFGSFKFTVPGSANGVVIDGVICNNSYFGGWVEDGQNNVVRNLGSECPGAYLWVSGSKNLILENIFGEGNGLAGIYFHNVLPGGSVYVCSMKNISATGGKPIFTDIQIACLHIDTCELLATPGQYAIQGAHLIGAIWLTPTNKFDDPTRIADDYCAEYQLVGLSVNHAKAPQAAIDAKLLAYNVPAFIHRVNDAQIYTQLGGPVTQYDSTVENYTQMISSGTGNPGARSPDSITRAVVAGGAAAANFGYVNIIDAGATFVELIITGTLATDSTHSNYWKIRQGVNREGAVMNLIGAQTTLDSVIIDAAIPAPTIVADAAAGVVRARLTGHATTTVVWAIRFTGVGTGR